MGVEFYFVNGNGEHNTYMHEEFINLLDNHRFDYKSNVRVANEKYSAVVMFVNGILFQRSVLL